MFLPDEHVLKRGKGKEREVTCKYCEANLPPVKDRWESHMRNCKYFPAGVAGFIPSNKKRKANESVTIVSNATSASLDQIDSISNVSISRWIDRTSAALNSELNDSFSDMIYSTGVPFAFADHPKVKDFIMKLKPSWKPPSAKTVAGSLLSNRADNLKIAIDRQIRDCPYLTLVSDGWSNIRREHMVNYVAVSPLMDHPILIATEDTGEMEQDGEEIANAFSKKIEAIGLDKVIAVVTDNAPNMQKAWKLLEKKYPTLIVNGCGAHTFNLLVKDICLLEEFRQPLEQARAITHYIMSQGKLRKRLSVIQKLLVEQKEIKSARNLVYVGETRWYTHHLCILRLIENRKALANLITMDIFTKMKDRKDVKINNDQVSKAISNMNFWKSLVALEKVLQPTSKYIGILESNECSLSDIYGAFSEMESSFSDNSRVLTLIRKRWNFVHTESMSMSYYLDPKTKGGAGLVGDDIFEVVDNIVAYAIERRQLLHITQEEDLRKECHLFAAEMIAASGKLLDYIHATAPRVFWNSYGRTKYKLLFPVANILFSIPTSQAASERVWSIYDFVHSKRRNRLSAEKVTALVQILINEGILDKSKSVFNVLMGEDSDVSDDEDVE